MRMSNELYSQLTLLATALRESKSKLIRRFITESLEENAVLLNRFESNRALSDGLNSSEISALIKSGEIVPLKE